MSRRGEEEDPYSLRKRRRGEVDRRFAVRCVHSAWGRYTTVETEGESKRQKVDSRKRGKVTGPRGWWGVRAQRGSDSTRGGCSAFPVSQQSAVVWVRMD